MNTRTLVGITLALTLSISLLAWAQSPTNLSAGSAGPLPAKSSTTYSRASDSNYLFDQIDMRIKFKSGAEFVVSTRPGEHIFVTIPAGKDTEKRLGLVVMPAPFGENVVSRQELLARDQASIGFRMMPYCLNSLAHSNVTDRTTPASCMERKKSDVGEDFVLPLSALMKKEIAIGDEVEEVVTGTFITILDYRQSGHISLEQLNPYTKCCGANKGVEVCSCSVISPTSSCALGCPVSEAMKTAFEPKS